MDSREVAYTILFNIEKQGTFSNDALQVALRRNQFTDKKERSFVTRLVEGVTERKITLDFLIKKASKKGNVKLKPQILTILRMGVYQIVYMDNVPDRAAISESVNLAKNHNLSSLSGYVNAVLHSICDIRDEGRLDSLIVSNPSIKYSTPKWLCDFLVNTFGKETAFAILEDQFAEHDTVIRINTLKTDKNAYKSLIDKADIKYTDGILSDRCIRIKEYDHIKKLPGYRDGLFTVQDETSVYTIEHIGIKPGDKVLDICSAPGGKSMLSYELATKDGKAGTVVSRDISNNKIDKIEENAERMCIPVRVLDDDFDVTKLSPGINLQISDATELDTRIASLSDSDKFDVVIADVPCSGLGIIGRKNDIKYNVTQDSMKKLAGQGLVILKNAAEYVKKGGRLCFSTCTINPGENGEVVEHFINNTENKTFKVIEEKTFLQGINGSDGFYYCIMERISE